MQLWKVGLARRRKASGAFHEVGTEKCMNWMVSSSIHSSCRGVGSGGPAEDSSGSSASSMALMPTSLIPSGGKPGLDVALLLAGKLAEAAVAAAHSWLVRNAAPRGGWQGLGGSPGEDQVK